MNNSGFYRTQKNVANRQALSENYIFIHINKTGGSSIEKALGLQKEHLTALEKIKEIGIKKWKKCYTFTIVRNPWDKVVSHYHYRLKTNQTGLRSNKIGFSQWLKFAYKNNDSRFYDQPKMFMPNYNWIFNPAGKKLVDDIYHFENLQAEFKSLSMRLGKNNLVLPHELSSSRGHYQQYYDTESKELIENIFKKDIKEFKYKF